MAAALSGSDRCVNLLLSYAVDPNVLDQFGNTALIYAMQAGVNSTVGKFAQVTTARGFNTLRLLSRFYFSSKPLLHFLHKCPPADIQDALGVACFFATKLFKIILRSGHVSQKYLDQNF